MEDNRNVVNPGLYSEEYEHDNCGIGAVVNIKGIKTHETVNNALKIVENLEHRAGKDAEGKTGDGVGILLQISHKFFKKAVAELGYDLGKERDYGIGMFFFPQDELPRKQAMKMFEVLSRKRDLSSCVGEWFRLLREFLERRLLMLCRALCRHLSRDLTA